MANEPNKRLDYNRKDVLGAGAYGVVFKGTLQVDGEIIDVAIKRFETARTDTMISWDREMTLNELNHPNVVKVYGVEEEDDDFV